jgi:hypothetical protein
MRVRSTQVLSAEGFAHEIAALAGRRHDSEDGERASVNHCPAIRRCLECTISAVDGIALSYEMIA